VNAVYTTQSEGETVRVGVQLGRTIEAGDVILLYGDLGAGKTAFVRGLAEGIGGDPTDVSSPTFTIMQEYRGGRVPLFHVDLYRLNDPREIEDLGLEEIAADGVLAIEWAEKLDADARLKPSRYITVRLAHREADVRTITVATNPGSTTNPEPTTNPESRTPNPYSDR
jgi:tRNA threonylcarbamoyladenosine biosynthesis protein TsaE